jgi:CBS domain-containing protein
MAEEDISALVVVDEEGYLTGIITRTDLLRARAECIDWMAQPVEAWMSKEVVTVSPNEHLTQVTHLLLERQIHRVVAVEEEGGKLRPVVVISSADLVYHMARGNI